MTYFHSRYCGFILALGMTVIAAGCRDVVLQRVSILNDLSVEVSLDRCPSKERGLDPGDSVEVLADRGCAIFERKTGFLGVKTAGDYIGCLVIARTANGDIPEINVSEAVPTMSSDECYDLKIAELAG